MPTLGSESHEAPTSPQPQAREKRNAVNCHNLERRCPVLVNIGNPHVGVRTMFRYQIHGHSSTSKYLRIRPYKQLKAAYAQSRERTLAPLSTHITYVAIASEAAQPPSRLPSSKTLQSHNGAGTDVNPSCAIIFRYSLDQGVTVRAVPHLCLCPTKVLWAIKTLTLISLPRHGTVHRPLIFLSGDTIHCRLIARILDPKNLELSDRKLQIYRLYR